MFRHQMCHPQRACFVTLLNYISKIAALAKINKIFKTLKLRYVPGRYTSSINTQFVYTTTKQTSCNNNYFITLNNFYVLKILLILARAAIVLT